MCSTATHSTEDGCSAHPHPSSRRGFGFAGCGFGFWGARPTYPHVTRQAITYLFTNAHTASQATLTPLAHPLHCTRVFTHPRDHRAHICTPRCAGAGGGCAGAERRSEYDAPARRRSRPARRFASSVARSRRLGPDPPGAPLRALAQTHAGSVPGHNVARE
eukprot:1995752-Rhodomonas_salina.1